jgi:hypothetical protein
VGENGGGSALGRLQRSFDVARVHRGGLGGRPVQTTIQRGLGVQRMTEGLVAREARHVRATGATLATIALSAPTG